MTIGETRLEQGHLAFLLPIPVAQVRFPIYLQEQKENSVLISGYISAKKARTTVIGFSAEPNGIKLLTIHYHQSLTDNL